MNLVSICLVLLVGICSFGLATRPLPFSRVVLRENRNEIETTCKSSDGPIIGCTSDCKALNMCINDVIYPMDCEKQTITKPYCNKETKECVAEPQCQSDNQDFHCPMNGYFPHPLNCKMFYGCEDNQSDLYECLGSMIYDPFTRRCTTGIPCYSFSSQTGLCRNKIGQPVVHPRNPSIYVYCFTEPVVMSCESDDIAFNPTTKICEFRCTREGPFADTVRNDHYYLCSRVGNTFKAEHKSCDAGQIFDNDKKACIRETTTAGFII